jgi:hypothetical protein
MLCLSACYKEYNAANERHRAKDGRQWNVVCLFACSVNRSDVDDLFPGCVRKERTIRNVMVTKTVTVAKNEGPGFSSRPC